MMLIKTNKYKELEEHLRGDYTAKYLRQLEEFVTITPEMIEELEFMHNYDNWNNRDDALDYLNGFLYLLADQFKEERNVVCQLLNLAHAALDPREIISTDGWPSKLAVEAREAIGEFLWPAQ